MHVQCICRARMGYLQVMYEMTLQSIKPEIMHKVSSNSDTYIGHKADMSGSTCIT